MSVSQYEISFLLNGLHQFRFEGSEEQADAIRSALRKDSDASDVAVGDLQVYPTMDSQGGSAEQMVEDIVHELMLSEEDKKEQSIDELLAMARRVDDASGQTQDFQPVLLEFVWENGGGDDNPYATSFDVDPAQEQLNDAFTEAFSDWLENFSHGYAFSCGVASEQHPLMTLEQAVDAAQDVFQGAGINTTNVMAWLQARELDETTPKTSLPKPRRAL